MSEENSQQLVADTTLSSSHRISTEDQFVSGTKYRLLGKYFAAGSFGEIHFCQNTQTGDTLAAKLVPKDNERVQLESEYRFYQMLGQFQGIPKIYHFGECNRYHVIVMELLGPSLEKVFAQCQHQFSLSTTIRLASQLMDLIEYIHSRRIIFRNVKPENFCLGRPNTPMANQLYLIGFIHANIYENDNHEHIPKVKGLPFAGTPRYMSIRAHKGKEQSRRDDLESIGNMLIYFVKGRLPWQGLTAYNDTDKYDQIYRVKKSTQMEELCDQLPQEFYHYMLYVRSLKFRSEPNYGYLKTMFVKLINRLGIKMTDNYDWNNRTVNPNQFAISPPITPVVSNHEKIGAKKTVSFDMNSNTVR